MPFATTAIGIGSLLAGAASAGSAVASGKLNRKNRAWQEKMYNKQVQVNRENTKQNWQDVRDYAKWSYDNYESPVAQRAAMKAAGINPYADGSVIQPMGATQGSASAADGGSVPAQGPYQNNPMSNIQAGFTSLRDGGMALIQAKNVEAQTELTNATRMKTLAETVGIENQNSLFQYVKAAAESDLLSKKFKNIMLEVEARFAEAKGIADLAERKAKIAEIWSEYEKNLSQAAKNDADRVTVEQTRKFVVAQEEAKVDLIEAQTDTEGAKQDNLRSGAGLNRAQISRIEELTPAEKKEIRNRAAELANRMQNLSHEQKRRDLDLLLESAGLKNHNEPLLLTASLIKQVRTAIRTLELDNAIEKLFEEVYHVKL